MHQCDLCRKERILTDKALGTVYRIDEPEKFGINLCLSRLFTVETVLGKGAEYDLADCVLALHVSLGHRRHIRFGRNREITGIVFTADVRGFIGGCQRYLQVIRCVFCVIAFHLNCDPDFR